MIKIIAPVITFGVLWMLLTGIQLPVMSFFISLIFAGIVFFVIKNIKKAPSEIADISGFNPDFKTKNMSIDTKQGKLWIRDADGNATFLDKNDVLRWNLQFVSFGPIHTKNHIEIHVRNLSRPMWAVPFDRHGKIFKSDEKKNALECEEWHSRLSTWLHE